MSKKRASVPGSKKLNTYEVARQEGDPILRRGCAEVEVWDANLRSLGMRLKMMVVRDRKSLGLAAPQIGIPFRMLAYRDSVEGQVHILTNPVIVERSDATEEEIEGCFSVRRGMVRVARAAEIRVEACSLAGAPVVVEASGLGARCLQHEIDHLDGKLIVDYGDLIPPERVEAEMQKDAEARQERARKLVAEMEALG